MLKVIWSLVLLLVVSVFSDVSNEIVDEERRKHCPYGSSEIHTKESIVGLSCISRNCVNETQICWGSTICDSSYGTSCELFEGFLCQTEMMTSSLFKVCRSISLETSTVNDLSQIMESSSEEETTSTLELLGVGIRDLSSKLIEDKVNILGKFYLSGFIVILGFLILLYTYNVAHFYFLYR